MKLGQLHSFCDTVSVLFPAPRAANLNSFQLHSLSHKPVLILIAQYCPEAVMESKQSGHYIRLKRCVSDSTGKQLAAFVFVLLCILLMVVYSILRPYECFHKLKYTPDTVLQKLMIIFKSNLSIALRFCHLQVDIYNLLLPVVIKSYLLFIILQNPFHLTASHPGQLL